MSESESFVLEGKELDSYRKFRRHKCTTRRMGEPDPLISVTFTQTGIGTAVEVRCHCGREKNITDYETW